MGKRQIRIFPHQIFDKSKTLIGKEANVTLQNLTTFHGIILEVLENQIQLRDMRLKKRTFPITDIAEVVLDTVTEW